MRHDTKNVARFRFDRDELLKGDYVPSDFLEYHMDSRLIFVGPGGPRHQLSKMRLESLPENRETAGIGATSRYHIKRDPLLEPGCLGLQERSVVQAGADEVREST